MKKVTVLLVVLLGATGTADARGHWTLTKDHPRPHVARAAVPRTVDPYDFGSVPIARDAETVCLRSTYCVLDANPTVIHAPAGQLLEQWTVHHEKGHVLDFTATTAHRARAAWLRANGYPAGTSWGSHTWGDPDAPFEQFAESYAACSLRYPPATSDYDHGWAPTATQYRATCRVLRREVSRLAVRTPGS